MNKLFGQIFETYNDFKEKVIDYINDLESNPIYLNDPSFKYTQEKIFEIIRIYFKNSEHNYNDDELFIQSFRIKYANAFMNFYFKSNELNKIELDKLTNDWFNDIAKVESNSKSNSNAKNESRISTTPVSKQIQDLLDTLPLNNADRTTIENAITNNTLTTNQVINGYSLYQRAINSNLSLQFDNLIRKLSNMFMQIGNNLESDYKQLDADQLILLEKRVASLEEAVVVLDETKQDKLKAGKDIEITEDNTINYIGKGSGGGISPEDKAQIQKNKEDIATLNNDVEELGNISNQNQSDINTIKAEQIEQNEKFLYLNRDDYLLANEKNISRIYLKSKSQSMSSVYTYNSIFINFDRNDKVKLIIEPYNNKYVWNSIYNDEGRPMSYSWYKEIVFDSDIDVPHIKWVKNYVANHSGRPVDYDQVKEQVESNKNYIELLKNYNVEQDSKISNIKEQQIQQERDITDNSHAIEENTRKINDYISKNEGEISNLKAKDTQIENNIKQTNIKIDGIVLDGTTRKNTIDNRTLLSFQLNISSHRESGFEWQSELPSEIQNTTFVYVESIEYSCLETGSEFGYKVFSPYIANISAYKKNNKLCLRNENNIPSYINYIRFRVLVG